MKKGDLEFKWLQKAVDKIYFEKRHCDFLNQIFFSLLLFKEIQMITHDLPVEKTVPNEMITIFRFENHF